MPLTAFAASNDVVGIEGGQTYYIKNLYTGRYLDVYGGQDVNGQNVWTYPFNGTVAQKWRSVRNTDGTYTFYAVVSSNNRVLDVTGTNVDIYNNTYPTDQKFTLVRDTTLSYGGTYNIKLGTQYVTETISTSNVCITSSASGLASMWSFQVVDKSDVDFYPFYYQNGSILFIPTYFDTRGASSTISSQMGALGYPTYTLTNCDTSSAYTYMQSDDVWVFNGHGLENGNGTPLASIVFMDSSGNQNGYITPNSAVCNGTSNRYIDSLTANALAPERSVLYIGCSTGKTYTQSGISYNLVTSTFKRGAHFALGTTQTIDTSQSETWLKKFFEKARAGGTIRQCLDNANYYQSLGLLYYEGDVYAKFS